MSNKTLARILKELVYSGGRVTEESIQVLDNIIDKALDDLDIPELTEELQEYLENLKDDVATKIDEIRKFCTLQIEMVKDRVDILADNMEKMNAAKAQAAKKAQAKK